jgi:cell division protein FtsB
MTKDQEITLLKIRFADAALANIMFQEQIAKLAAENDKLLAKADEGKSDIK